MLFSTNTCLCERERLDLERQIESTCMLLLKHHNFEVFKTLSKIERRHCLSRYWFSYSSYFSKRIWGNIGQQAYPRMRHSSTGLWPTLPAKGCKPAEILCPPTSAVQSMISPPCARAESMCCWATSITGMGTLCDSASWRMCLIIDLTVSFRPSCQNKRDVPSIVDTSAQVKTTRAIKFVFGNSVSISDQGGAFVLELDEFDELIRSYAGLVTQSEAFGEELDESEFERVTDEPNSYQRTCS